MEPCSLPGPRRGTMRRTPEALTKSPTRWRGPVCAMLLLTLPLTGCAKKICARAETIAVRIHPSEQLNPDRDGYSRSLVVRVYQMASADRFRQMQFEEIWRSTDEGDRSKGEARPSTELTVLPSKREERVITRVPEAKFLGIVANFREHEPGSAWRSVITLPNPHPLCPTNLHDKAKAYHVAESKLGARYRVDLALFGMAVEGAREEDR